MRHVEVTPGIRNKVAVEGEACERWLASLSDLLDALERDWGITVGATIDGGTASFVAEATERDGRPAVLKLAMPAAFGGWDSIEHEVWLLRAASGRGCVRMLRDDVARGAVLLERLGRQVAQLDLPLSRQLEIICATVRQVWAAPRDERLPTGDAKGRWLAHSIADEWEALDHPCSEPVVERAIEIAERRSDAFDLDRAVVVHGDAHVWNTLEDPGSPGGFKLVDPDGLLAEPEYDVAISMREYSDELLAGDPLALGRERARYLARLTGLDPEKIWDWGFVERVSNGLLSLRLGYTEGGMLFLQIAEAWAVE
jgi:streptomycin 6-kinase